MATYARVSAGLGFTKYRTKRAGFSQLFWAETKKANEYLNFTKADLAKINKEQGFNKILLKNKEQSLMSNEQLAMSNQNPLLFKGVKGEVKAESRRFQSLFKHHFKNPELFYLFSVNERIKTALSSHLSPFTSHLKNPNLHSSLWAKLREGRGELWRLKRCKLIAWAFYKERPKPVITLVCPLRPPSHRLPLPLFHEKEVLDSRYLPLPLNCWDFPLREDPEPNLIIKENHAMILENSAEFTINDQAVNALSCSLSTADTAYCWQFSLSIFYEDWENLDLELDTKPQVKIKINGYEWLFILEDVKTVKRFNSFIVELTGRSPTAELGADYASRLSGLFPSEIYSRQICDNLLEFSAFSIADWLITDALHPADSVELSDKSPIAVITELAAANSGFIETKLNGYELVAKPRYKVKAWEIAETAADVSVPLSHITELATERQVNSEFNAVRIVGNTEGVLVYREEQDRSKEAPITQSPLFTEFQQMREKGIEILGDSGKHQKHELKTWLGTANSKEEDNMPLAQLGDIWEIRGENIKGIVRGISLNLMLDNEALKIEQTLSIDEYIN